MNVFVDFVGHADLYYSMHALFEKRLGFKLYRPSNLDPRWSELNVFTPQPPGYFTTTENGIYSPVHNYEQNLLTFEQFLKTDFVFIVSSSWTNEQPLFDIVQKHKKSTPFIRHVSNIGETPVVAKKCLLAETTPMPPGIDYIQWHPEQHPDFKPDFCIQLKNTIKSYFNCFPSYQTELKSWDTMKTLLPDFEFRMHGHDCHEPGIHPQDLPEHMRNCTFIWHTKPHGSCGYVARQALFSGKVLIVKKQYARQYNTLAINYLVDGINCLDLSSRTPHNVAQTLKDWSRPENYTEICTRAYEETKKRINFEVEASQIRTWLSTFVEEIK